MSLTCAKLQQWPLPAPLSATKLAIILLVSFHKRSGYINSQVSDLDFEVEFIV